MPAPDKIHFKNDLLVPTKSQCAQTAALNNQEAQYHNSHRLNIT